MADRPLRRRRRAARTCVECRRRKIKCDRQEPCNHCIATKTTCSYRPFARTEGVAAASAEVVETGHPQEQLRADGDNDSSHTSPRTSGRRHSSQTTAEGRRPSEAQGASPLWEHLLEKGIEAEKQQTNPANTQPSPQEVLQSKDTEGQHSQILLNKTRMLQVGHVLGSAPQFKTILSCFLAATGERPDPAFQDTHDDTAAMVSEMGQLLRECKDIARRIKESRPSRTLSSVRFDLSLPTREISDSMARLYFSHFESTHRILHIPSFWKEYHEFWDRKNSIRQTLGDPLNYRSPTHTRLKILLVLAIGSALHHDATTDLAFRARAQQWIHASQVWLSGPLEKDRLDISGIQIYCLTILARQIFAIGGDLAWMSCGTLVHVAMQTGLHRDPKHFMKGSITVLDAEVRRRLWATILELVVGVSLDVALPSRVKWDEFDTEAPANLNDEDLTADGPKSLDMVGPMKPKGRDRGVYTSTSMQLMLYESLELRLGVLEKLHGLKSELSYVEILSLSTDVSNAYNEALSLLNKFFMRQGPRSSSTTSPPTTTIVNNGPKLFHKNLLDLLLRRFLVHMHFSFAARAHTEPLFHFSLKTCLDGAIDMIHAIDPQPNKDAQHPQQHNAYGITADQHTQDLAFSRLMIIGGGMFREVIRSSLSIVCLELLAIIQESYGIKHASSPSASPATRVPNPFFSPSNLSHASIPDRAPIPSVWQQSASTKIYITALKHAAAQVTSVCLERIKSGGETNIKGYMFARLFLAEIESIEAGLQHYSPRQTAGVGGEGARTIENAVARAGRDSVELCRHVLREWESRAKERESQVHGRSAADSVVGMTTPRDSSDVSPFVPGPGVFGMPAGSGLNGRGVSGGGSGVVVDVSADQGNGLGMPPLASMPYGVAVGGGLGDYVGFNFDGFEGFGFEMGSGLHAFL